MIIHLHTMTVDELLDLQNEVFDVYCDSVCFADLAFGEQRDNWQDTANQAWHDLSTLTTRIEHLTGETGCIRNTGAGLLRGESIRVGSEQQQDPAAAAARDHVCAGCGCSLGPAWMQTAQTKRRYCLSCFDCLPVDENWNFAS